MCFGSASFPSIPIPPFLRDNYSGKNISTDTNVVESVSKSDQTPPNEPDIDKAPDPITAKANEIAAYYTADERAMAETIYGEAGGMPLKDKLAVGWTMRARKDKYPDLSYHNIATHPQWYAPLDSLREANNGELRAWAESFRAARNVLNANRDSNPIPGVTHFYDPSREPPDWTEDATRVQYGSGALLYYKGVKWSK